MRGRRPRAEVGRWKIELPHVEVGDPYWDEVDVGPFPAWFHKRGEGTRQMMRVSGPLRAEVADIRAAVLDFAAWPRFVRLVREARALEPPDARHEQRVYVRLEAPGGAAAMDYIMAFHHASASVSPDLGVFNVGWRIAPAKEGPAPAVPVVPGVARLTVMGATLMVGRRGLERVVAEYGVTVDPAEWPRGFAEQLVTAEGLVRFLTAIEEESLRRGRGRTATTR